MARQCPVGMENISEMQEIYGWYPNKDRNYLNNAVLAWQEYREVSQDTFPDDRRTFSMFLSRTLPRLNMTSGASQVSRQQLLDRYLALYDTFTPQQLRDRVEMLARDFSDIIDDYMTEHPVLSRDKAIAALGGARGIFRQVKHNYDFQSAEELYEWLADGRNYNAEDTVKARKQADALFEEFKKIKDNFSDLVPLIYDIISETEDINEAHDRLSVDIEADKEEDNDERHEESGVSERYEDTRTTLVQDSISVRVKRMLRNVPMRDRNGKIVRNELGAKKYVNPAHVHNALLQIVSNSTAETFLDDIKLSTGEYPWMDSIYNAMLADSELKTAIFVNYNRSETRYAASYMKGNEQKLMIRNAASRSMGLANHVHSTILAGLVIEPETSIYDSNAKLVDKGRIGTQYDRLKKIHESSRMLGLKHDDTRNKIDKIGKWADEHPDDVSCIVNLVRGIGINIDRETFRQAIVTARDRKDRRLSASRLASVLDALDEIYHDAFKHHDTVQTGDALFGRNMRAYRKISDAIGSILDERTESSARSNGKTYSTYVQKNLIHQIADEFRTAAATMTKDEHDAWLAENYGRFEGCSLPDGSIPGWIGTGGFTTVLDLADYNGKPYEELTAAEKFAFSYLMYKKGIEGAGCCFEVPIMSDYETCNYVAHRPLGRWKRPIANMTQAGDVEYDLNNIAVSVLYDEVLLEINRINAIKERMKDPDRIAIPAYERNGVRFGIFTEFNTNGFMSRYLGAVKQNPSEAEEFVRTEIAKQLHKIFRKDFLYAMNNGVFDMKEFEGWTDVDGNFRDDEHMMMFQNFVIEHFYAQQQISKIMFGSKLFFKDANDANKRQMMAHAPRLPLDTRAEWNGKRVGKDSERVMYLHDAKKKSAYLPEMESMFSALEADGFITNEQKKEYVSAYSDITTTDGQVFRTLKSFREIRVMLQQWSDEYEAAYIRIMQSSIGDIRFTRDDLNLFMTSVLKPMTSGFEQVEVVPGTFVKVPVMHKCSEAVLLPPVILDFIGVRAPVLLAMSEAAMPDSENPDGIDAFLFNSSVKVGGFGQVNIFGTESDGSPALKNGKAIARRLVESKRLKGVIHTIPYRYYGITSSTPVHAVDATRSWSQQAIKCVMTNIGENETITPADGVSMTGNEGKSLLYRIQEVNVIEAYKELTSLFDSPAELERTLQEELASKSYNSPELRYMLSMLDDGEFAMPLFNPAIMREAQQIITAIVRKRLTRQKTNGGSIIQETSLGFDFDGVRYDDDTPDGQKFNVVFDGTGKDRRIRHIECYIPMFDSRLGRFADSTGGITAEYLQQLVANGDIDEDALEFIGYRTPSDDAHSVIPMKIKGFLPNIYGATILLPKEVQVMTGNDFDVDKMMVHFKELNFSEWDEDLLKEDYGRMMKMSDEDIVRIILGQEEMPDSQPYQAFRSQAIANNPDRYRKARVSTVKYDYGASPLDNTQRARNNAMIDLMFAELTSPAGSRRMLLPGGFETTKRIGKAFRILRMSQHNERILEAMKRRGGAGKTFRFLMSIRSAEIGDIISAEESEDSPYTMSNTMESFSEIVRGKQMIDRYALYKTGIAQLQGSGVAMKGIGKEGRYISMFGHTLRKLDGITDRAGNYISRTIGQLINAATDNGKDPILGSLNQNGATAPYVALLAAGGFTQEDIMLFLNQPAAVMLAKHVNDGIPAKLAAQAVAGLIVGPEGNTPVKGTLKKLSSIPAELFAEGIAAGIDGIRHDLDLIEADCRRDAAAAVQEKETS